MKAFLFTKMAWNNLRRYRRRTILVGLTILLSSAVLIFNNSLGNGIEEQLIQNMVYIQTGHIVLTPQADSRDPATETVRWQPLPPGLSTFLASDPRLRGIHPRLESAALLTANNQTITRAFLIGFDPREEAAFLKTRLPILQGSPFGSSASKAIFLSQEYARRLKVGLGDPVTLTIHNPRGETRMKDFQLGGLFRKANPWQEFFVFAPLDAVQDLFGTPNQISSVRLILHKVPEVTRVRNDLQAFITKKQLPWTVKGFQEVGGFSLGIIQANNFSIVLMDSLLLLITAIGISLLILLSLQLRVKEIGILSLLGTPPGWLLFSVIQEALLLGLLFGGLGLIMGWGLAWYFQNTGIRITSLPLTYLLGGDSLRPLIRLQGMGKVFSLLLGICFFSALLPMINLLWASSKKRARSV